MPVPLSNILRHYKRPEVQDAIVKAALDREIAPRYGEGFGKRPDVLMYPRDVLEFAKKGASSFHCSEERWVNPLQLDTAMKRTDLDDLRSGWDLLIDIDCPSFMISTVCADIVVNALRYHDVDCISTKFSGNHGWHIGIPFEAFPTSVGGVNTKNLFPEGPRRILMYLQDMIRTNLTERLLEFGPSELAKELKVDSVVKNGRFDPFEYLELDAVLISSRHMFRMPYSFNEKSGLVSVPWDPRKVLDFSKDAAHFETFEFGPEFLNRDVTPNVARKLLIAAFDFKPAIPEEELEKKNEFQEVAEAIPEMYWPPCVKLICQGLEDGKKRAIFVLINFMQSCGWSKEAIEVFLNEWNKKNPEPLREQYIVGQVRYKGGKKAMPPNCDNTAYMKGINVCRPDGLCSKIKNPVNYAIIRQRIAVEDAKQNEKKAKKEPKKEINKEPGKTS